MDSSQETVWVRGLSELNTNFCRYEKSHTGVFTGQDLIECVLNAHFSLPVSLSLLCHLLHGNLVQDGKLLITGKPAFVTLSETFSLRRKTIILLYKIRMRLWKLFQCRKHAPSSRPLLSLFPLSATLFSQTHTWFVSPPPEVFAQISPLLNQLLSLILSVLLI